MEIFSDIEAVEIWNLGSFQGQYTKKDISGLVYTLDMVQAQDLVEAVPQISELATRWEITPLLSHLNFTPRSKEYQQARRYEIKQPRC